MDKYFKILVLVAIVLFGAAYLCELINHTESYALEIATLSIIIMCMILAIRISFCSPKRHITFYAYSFRLHNVTIAGYSSFSYNECIEIDVNENARATDICSVILSNAIKAVKSKSGIDVTAENIEFTFISIINK